MPSRYIIRLKFKSFLKLDISSLSSHANEIHVFRSECEVHLIYHEHDDQHVMIKAIDQFVGNEIKAGNKLIALDLDELGSLIPVEVRNLPVDELEEAKSINVNKFERSIFKDELT